MHLATNKINVIDRFAYVKRSVVTQFFFENWPTFSLLCCNPYRERSVGQPIANSAGRVGNERSDDSSVHALGSWRELVRAFAAGRPVM